MNAAALITDVSNPSRNPQSVATSSTASRYATPVDSAGEISRSGKISAVIAATASVATTSPESRAWRLGPQEQARRAGGHQPSIAPPTPVRLWRTGMVVAGYATIWELICVFHVEKC